MCWQTAPDVFILFTKQHINTSLKAGLYCSYCQRWLKECTLQRWRHGSTWSCISKFSQSGTCQSFQHWSHPEKQVYLKTHLYNSTCRNHRDNQMLLNFLERNEHYTLQTGGFLLPRCLAWVKTRLQGNLAWNLLSKMITKINSFPIQGSMKARPVQTSRQWRQNEAPCTRSLDSMIPERIVSWLPSRAHEPTESTHRIRTGSNRGSKVSRFKSVPGLMFVCTESARIPSSSSVVFAFVSFFFCWGVFFSAFFSCLSVVCATVTAPLTGVGGVLQRIQSDPLGSCACKFLWTRLHLHAIKDSIRVKNEPGIIESRLRVHGAWDCLVYRGLSCPNHCILRYLDHFLQLTAARLAALLDAMSPLGFLTFVLNYKYLTEVILGTVLSFTFTAIFSLAGKESVPSFQWILW